VKLKTYIYTVLVCVAVLFLVNTNKAYSSEIILRDGTKIQGTITQMNDTSVSVKASFGLVTIPRDKIADIKLNGANQSLIGKQVIIHLNNGTSIEGKLLKENNYYLVMQASFGQVTVERKNVASIKEANTTTGNYTNENSGENTDYNTTNNTPEQPEYNTNQYQPVQPMNNPNSNNGGTTYSMARKPGYKHTLYIVGVGIGSSSGSGSVSSNGTGSNGQTSSANANFSWSGNSETVNGQTISLQISPINYGGIISYGDGFLGLSFDYEWETSKGHGNEINGGLSFGSFSGGSAFGIGFADTVNFYFNGRDISGGFFGIGGGVGYGSASASASGSNYSVNVSASAFTLYMPLSLGYKAVLGGFTIKPALYSGVGYTYLNVNTSDNQNNSTTTTGSVFYVDYGVGVTLGWSW